MRLGLPPDPAFLNTFQSTHPRGVRPGAGTGRRLTNRVSIHAPAGGATARLVDYDSSVPVSIHAPAGGATVCLLSSKISQCYSTLSDDLPFSPGSRARHLLSNKTFSFFFTVLELSTTYRPFQRTYGSRIKKSTSPPDHKKVCIQHAPHVHAIGSQACKSADCLSPYSFPPKGQLSALSTEHCPPHTQTPRIVLAAPSLCTVVLYALIFDARQYLVYLHHSSPVPTLITS